MPDATSRVANELVSQTVGGTTTSFAYDVWGRMTYAVYCEHHNGVDGMAGEQASAYPIVFPAQAGIQKAHEQDAVDAHWTPAFAGETKGAVTCPQFMYHSERKNRRLWSRGGQMQPRTAGILPAYSGPAWKTLPSEYAFLPDWGDVWF